MKKGCQFESYRDAVGGHELDAQREPDAEAGIIIPAVFGIVAEENVQPDSRIEIPSGILFGKQPCKIHCQDGSIVVDIMPKMPCPDASRDVHKILFCDRHAERQCHRVADL